MENFFAVAERELRSTFPASDPSGALRRWGNPNTTHPDRWRSWQSPFADGNMRRVFERGVGNHGDHSRFLAFARMLLSRKPVVTIEAVGGSVTYAGSHKRGWLYLFQEWLKVYAHPSPAPQSYCCCHRS